MSAGAIAIVAAVAGTLTLVGQQRPRRMPLSPFYTIPLTSLGDYRRLAWALVQFAVNEEQGRPAFGDPVYENITLGLQQTAREQGWFFSSCAFLPHWMLETLGLVRPYVGRSTDADEPLSRLAWGDDSEAVRLTDEEPFGPRFLTGDIVQIGSNGDSHIFVVVDYTPPTTDHEGTMISADYGQPGGALRTRRVFVSSGQLLFADQWRTRPARRWIPLERAVGRALGDDPGEVEVVVNDEQIADLWTRVPELPGVSPAPKTSTPSSPRAPAVAARRRAGSHGGTLVALALVAGLAAAAALSAQT